ncbi:MAG: cysteine hydrolase family protein [Betaproteobacteria bacterium]
MKTIVGRTLLAAVLILSAGTILALDKKDPQKAVPQGRTAVLIEPEFTVNKAGTAVLIMDYENDIVSSLPEDVRVPLLERAAMIIKEARQANIPVIYVVVRFRDGYPEVNLQNKLFHALKESGRLREGTPGAEIDPKVAPLPAEIVVTKRRVGAFSTTDLETILRARNINTLVLCGISTSGVVLSTIRWAADMDYNLVVVSDVCADRDAEVHRVLMDKVFPWQATVVTSREFLKAIGAKDSK